MVVLTMKFKIELECLADIYYSLLNCLQFGKGIYSLRKLFFSYTVIQYNNKMLQRECTWEYDRHDYPNGLLSCLLSKKLLTDWESRI